MGRPAGMPRETYPGRTRKDQPRKSMIREINKSRPSTSTGREKRARYITYCLDGQPKFTALGSSFEEAVDLARDSYPVLRDFPRTRISFSVSTNAAGRQCDVEIASTAWDAVTSQLNLGRIIYITITPEAPDITREDVDGSIAPPRYDEMDEEEQSWPLSKKESLSSSPTPNTRNLSTSSSSSWKRKAKSILRRH